jgi:putative membrane protein
MQLLLILGVGFAIAAVLFALQNNVPVAVTFALWHFDSTLAVVLLVALGVGIFIAGLVSSPAMIKGKWAISRAQRQLVELEASRADNLRLIDELRAKPGQPGAVLPAEEIDPKPYVGLKAMMAGSAESGSRG